MVSKLVAMTTALNGSPAGRVAIVTGASRGVGQAAIRCLAAHGYNVVVNYFHDQRAAESIVDAILADNGNAVAVRADVADDLDVKRLFAETIAAFGGIDVVVHAAGSRITASDITKVGLDEFDALVRINTRATFVVSQQAAQHLRNGGAIVNLSSSADGSSLRTHGLYAATKAPTDVLTRAFALELRERNISVNAVSLEVHRPCAPSQVADVIAYLLSEHGHGLTGQVRHRSSARRRSRAVRPLGRRVPDRRARVPSTMCSAFRTFQGWTALSDMAHDQGVLHTVPIPGAMAYLMLRPLLADVPEDDMCGVTVNQVFPASQSVALRCSCRPSAKSPTSAPGIPSGGTAT